MEAPLAVSELRAEATPIAPETLTDPAPAVRVKACALLTVLDRVIFPPPPLLLRIVVPPKVIARKNEMFPLLAVILFASELLPVPF